MFAVNNIFWHRGLVDKAGRNRLNGHKSCLLWFTGLSASGKSTIATKVDELLFKKMVRSYVLDGDNVRHGLNSNLGFSENDRKENIRRISEVARLFVDAGVITITAFISPYKEDRYAVRSMFEEGEFIEVYIKCPLEVCEQRDPKGNYKKARAGIIKNYTGISAPYEEPTTAELIINTEEYNVDTSSEIIVDYLKDKNLIP